MTARDWKVAGASALVSAALTSGILLHARKPETPAREGQSKQSHEAIPSERAMRDALERRERQLSEQEASLAERERALQDRARLAASQPPASAHEARPGRDQAPSPGEEARKEILEATVRRGELLEALAQPCQTDTDRQKQLQAESEMLQASLILERHKDLLTGDLGAEAYTAGIDARFPKDLKLSDYQKLRLGQAYKDAEARLSLYGIPHHLLHGVGALAPTGGQQLDQLDQTLKEFNARTLQELTPGQAEVMSKVWEEWLH